MHSRRQFIDADAICAATFIRHVEVHESLDSTNTRAAELAREANVELPALVIARHQTAGRGRGQNKWWSADGALTFSVLLEPATFGIATANWPQLSLATAVAVCDALGLRIADCGLRIDEENPKSEVRNPQSSARLAIKWPNDVMLDGRKIAGILIESPGGTAPTKNRLIIGIGINVNNSWCDATHKAAQNAIALCDVTGSQHELQSVLSKCLRAMKDRYVQLANSDAALPGRWQELCSSMDQRVQIQFESRNVASGTCRGIATDGALLVENDGRTNRVYSGSLIVV